MTNEFGALSGGVDGASRFDQAHEVFDQNGIPFAIGDVVKVFHFIGARRKRHYMYKQVVGERRWPNGFAAWVLSHLNLKPAEEPDGGFYLAKDGRRCAGYEIVQCCSEYPEHFTARPRDTDGTATAAACKDMPVPNRNCQAGAAKRHRHHSPGDPS